MPSETVSVKVLSTQRRLTTAALLLQSHELWFGSSQPYRYASHHQNAGESNHHNHPHSRRGQGPAPAPLNSRALISSTTPANGLSALLVEERALRARKHNIASFGYSWLKPAGCTKTMLGMKEEEAEREEAMAAAAAEMAAAAADPGLMGGPHGQMDVDGQDDQIMERDLDESIPEAEDADAEGLVEEGEEGLEEDYNDDDDGGGGGGGGIIDDEDGFMERDLDDDIAEGFHDDDDDDDNDDDDDDENDELAADDGFDDQPDLDEEIPVPENHGDDGDGDIEELEHGMDHDLDEDIPEEDEWQHTDTDAESDDDDDDDGDDDNNEDGHHGISSPDSFGESLNLRTSTSSSVRGGLPRLPSQSQAQRYRNVEVHRPFLPRWSGGSGTDAFNSSGMMLDEEDLRASITSAGSRQSLFARRFPRRFGGPRDSLE